MAAPWFWMKSVAFFICDARLAASAGGASLEGGVNAGGPFTLPRMAPVRASWALPKLPAVGIPPTAPLKAGALMLL